MKKIEIILSSIIIFAAFIVLTQQHISQISFAQQDTQKKNVTTSLNTSSISTNQLSSKNVHFPLYAFTNDKKFETGISWNPKSILTNVPITFIIDFFSYPQNEPLHLWPYTFKLIQDGKEIYNTNGLTQIGSGIEKYVFSNSGKVQIRVENSQNSNSFTEYNAIVNKNPNATKNVIVNNENTSSPSYFGIITSYLLLNAVYAFIAAVVIILAILIIYIRRSRAKEEDYI